MNRIFSVLVGVAALLLAAVPLGAASAAPGTIQAPRIPITRTTSGNWAGYAVETNLANPASGFVSGVVGSWTVPSVTPSGTTAYSSIWVGIDGYSSSTVEQIGTEQDSSGKYYAWYEMYPKLSYVITSVPIKAGDGITASVTYTGSGNFVLSIKDTTSGASFSTTQKSNRAQRSSAEWIVEAPYSGGILPLADFGTVTFTGASFNNNLAIDAASSQYDPLTMEDPSGGVATPSGLTDGGTGFSVTYSPSTSPQATSSAPTVTGISPTSGPASGGTSVNITGTNFTGATGVAFGTTAATYTIVSDTQITATSPAGSGTVDVTVTTPNGTSATGSADQFTYTSTGAYADFAQPVQWTTSGGKNGTNNLQITLTLNDNTGNAVSGATISITLDLNGSLYGSTSGTTGTNGSVTFTANHAPSGTYSLYVDSVNSSPPWNGAQPAGETTGK